MKKLLKIASLSFALVAVLFMMNTKAAGTDTGELKLRVYGTSGYCIYGTNLDLSGYQFDYAPHTVSGQFAVTTGGVGNQWSCTDSAGVANRLLSIQAGTIHNMTTNVAANEIPATRIHVYSDLAAVVSGACTAVGGQTNGGTLEAAKTLIEKTQLLGDSCRVATNSVQLTVDLTGSQAIGQYSGVITINLPSL